MLEAYRWDVKGFFPANGYFPIEQLSIIGFFECANVSHQQPYRSECEQRKSDPEGAGAERTTVVAFAVIVKKEIKRQQQAEDSSTIQDGAGNCIVFEREVGN